MLFERIAPILPVKDLDAALDRYRRLGFTAHAYDGPQRYGFVDGGAVSLHLTEVGAGHPASAVYLYVDDADAVHEAWSAAVPEGHFHAPEDKPWGLREFTFVDPDGTVHRVGSPLVSDERPAWADEKAEIHPYDPQWASRAEVVRDQVATILSADVEHVGSTSVPGLAAKPIIDVMAEAEDLDAAVASFGAELAAAGWCYVPPELDQREWRRFFVLPDPSGQHRAAHLHLIQAGHHRWRDQLAFRDALRADPALVARYAALKRGLIDAYAGEREAYTEGKADFVREVLARR